MSDLVHIGEPPIAVRLRRSARARRFSLRISNHDGSVSLTVPKRASARAALAFVADQESWLRRHLDKRPHKVIPAFGGTIPLDGAMVPLVSGRGHGVQLRDGKLFVPEPQEAIPARLRGYFKAVARDRFAASSERCARMIGKEVRRITLRDTRSRWGSCSPDGNLMFSWRLMLAPRKVQDYVVAHEVCHLAEMNHSPAFWELVERVFPGHKMQRYWLRANGAELHRYQL